MPSPREIGLKENGQEFGPEPTGDEAPAGSGGAPQEKDYRANPVNPPEPAAPAKNLTR